MNTTTQDWSEDKRRSECAKLRDDLAAVLPGVTEPHRMVLLLNAAKQYATGDPAPVETPPAPEADVDPDVPGTPEATAEPVLEGAHAARLRLDALIGLHVTGVAAADCVQGSIAGYADGGFLFRPDGSDRPVNRPLHWNAPSDVLLKLSDLLPHFGIEPPAGKVPVVAPDTKRPGPVERPTLRPEHFIGCRVGIPDGTTGDWAKGEIVAVSAAGPMVRLDEDVHPIGHGDIVGAPWSRTDFEGKDLFPHFGNPLVPIGEPSPAREADDATTDAPDAHQAIESAKPAAVKPEGASDFSAWLDPDTRAGRLFHGGGDPLTCMAGMAEHLSSLVEALVDLADRYTDHVSAPDTDNGMNAMAASLRHVADLAEPLAKGVRLLSDSRHTAARVTTEAA